MGELSKGLGEGYEVLHNEKVYKFSLVNQDVKIKFKNRIYQYAIEAVKNLKKQITNDDYNSLLGQLSEADERDEFDIEGIRGRKALASIRGGILMVSLLTNCSEVEARDLIENNPEEIKLAIDKVVKDSFDNVEINKKKVKQVLV